MQIAGSISNKLNMPWSDLNIHILPQKNMRYIKRERYQRDIQEFKKKLFSEPQIKDCTFNRNLSLSVINFTL